MIYWLWFGINAVISLLFVIRLWPARVYANDGVYADFELIFGFLPAWFIFAFSTLASLVLMYVPGRRNRVILYVLLFAGSYLAALYMQHTVTAPIACLMYSVIGIGIWLVTRTLYKNSEYYDPHR